jgi:hypothetical protein
MENLYINHLAVWVCALANLVLGALWYSPLLFYKGWLKKSGLNEDHMAKANPVKTYGLAFLFAWIKTAFDSAG